MGAEVEYFGNWMRWRSIGENRSKTVKFETAIKRVFKVMAEAVIFICSWELKYAFMYGNFRELEDGSKELSCQGESGEVEERDANFGAHRLKAGLVRKAPLMNRTAEF